MALKMPFFPCLLLAIQLANSHWPNHTGKISGRLVFDRFRESGLTLKLTKCHFAGRSVRCLGHIVSDKGIMTDPDKIEVIIAWVQREYSIHSWV
jgi:hypothetical protein